jgi:hypothetical protein
VTHKGTAVCHEIHVIWVTYVKVKFNLFPDFCSYASATCCHCFCNPVSRSLCWQWWYKGSYNGRFGDLGGQEQKHSPRLVPRYIHCRGSVMWWCSTISKKENKDGISEITKKVDAQPSPLTCPIESPTKFRTPPPKKKKGITNYFIELKQR